jgi:short-subunit dehydrogenase
MKILNRNKTVVITGASRGIGYELAKIFAADSYKLVMISRNYERLLEIQRDLEKQFNTESLVIAKDLSLHNTAMEIFQELTQKNITVDVLVNNAGIGDFSMFFKEDFDRISRMMQLNIVTLTQLTRLFLDGMVERHEGRILNIASMAAFIPGPYMAVYYASKAYVKSFSEAIANELQGTGVTVTAVCPGLTKTGFQQEIGSENSTSAKLNLYSSPKEVAKFAVKAMAEGKEVAIPGIINQSLLYTNKIIPGRLRASIVKKMQEINRMTFFNE